MFCLQTIACSLLSAVRLVDVCPLKVFIVTLAADINTTEVKNGLYSIDADRMKLMLLTEKAPLQKPSQRLKLRTVFHRTQHYTLHARERKTRIQRTATMRFEWKSFYMTAIHITKRFFFPIVVSTIARTVLETTDVPIDCQLT